jgi:hypothetical protein
MGVIRYCLLYLCALSIDQQLRTPYPLFLAFLTFVLLSDIVWYFGSRKAPGGPKIRGWMLLNVITVGLSITVATLVGDAIGSQNVRRESGFLLVVAVMSLIDIDNMIESRSYFRNFIDKVKDSFGD